MPLRTSQFEISVEEIDSELIARGIQAPEQERFNFSDKEGTPGRDTLMEQAKVFYNSIPSPSLNPRLKYFSTGDLIKRLIGTIEEKIKRGLWGQDHRMDFYQLEEREKLPVLKGIRELNEPGLTPEDIKAIKRNSNSVAAICKKENLSDGEDGYSKLKVKNYGEVFNLCIEEPFRNQPISAGWLCTGFLVKEDLVATAGHCADENNVKDLRMVFGYKMNGPFKPVTRVPKEEIYQGEEIIGRVYSNGRGADWALVKLDRKVKGHPVVKLSEKSINLNQPVYILGHPCGLPLKYSAGAQVRGIDDSFFSADLNVYCGSSGSPVFDKDTHEVIGLVARGDSQDFRWTGSGWLSIIYPNPVYCSTEPQCTRVSEFIRYL